ncbi:MAG: hypothetical protein R2912_10760 [Eubacteriales bacterium]
MKIYLSGLAEQKQVPTCSCVTEHFPELPGCYGRKAGDKTDTTASCAKASRQLVSALPDESKREEELIDGIVEACRNILDSHG